MSFVNLLLHSLTEIPSTPSGVPITHYLPKNIDGDSLSALTLFSPLAEGHIVMPTDLPLTFHPLPAYGLLHITQGTGLFLAGNQHWNLENNCLVLFDCREGFSFRAFSSLEYDILYFNGSSASFFYDQLQHNQGCFLPSVSSSGLGTLLRSVFPGSGRYSSALSFHRILTDLLCELVELSAVPEPGETAIPDYLRQLKEYLDENYFRSITLSDLETIFFLNRYRICKGFRAVYSLPPIQYLHTARINKAKELLIETPLKIHEISYQVGYENTNLFIHHFKKTTGRTPAVYREQKQPR